MTAISSESVRAEVRCFALPTAHGELGRLSPSGLQILLKARAPQHLEPGCEVEVRLFDGQDPGPPVRLSGVVARLDRLPTGEQLLVVFARGLPLGEVSNRFLDILDRRGATRVDPPQPTPLWVYPPGGAAPLRGEVIDLSADGIGVSLPGTALPEDWPLEPSQPGCWRFDLDLGPGQETLRLAGQLKRIDRSRRTLRLGFRLSAEEAPDPEASRKRLLQLLRCWRG